MTTLIPGALDAPIVARATAFPAHDIEVALWPRADWLGVARTLRATPAVYLLIDSGGADRKVRVGETGDIGQRLAEHRYDRAQGWADCAVAVHGPAIDKAEAFSLQYAVEIFVRDRADATLMAFAPAPRPRIDKGEWRRINRVVDLILRALPRVGVALAPEPLSRLRKNGSYVVDKPIDFAEIECAFVFNGRGIEAAAATVGADVFVLAGSDIRRMPAGCARPCHKKAREDLTLRGLLSRSETPGCMQLTSPVRVGSLDAAGKLIVGDRHRYADYWMSCDPRDLPEACLDKLVDEVGQLNNGRRI